MRKTTRTRKAACEEAGVIHFSRKGKDHYNEARGKFQARTKGGNLNSWLYEFGKKYEFVTFLDPDHAPRPDFLDKVLGYFAKPDVAFVQGPQVFHNRSANWIARGAAEQSYLFYGPIQMGLFGIGACVVNGSHSTFRVRDLFALEGDGYAVHDADDILTSMRIHSMGKAGRLCAGCHCGRAGPGHMGRIFKTAGSLGPLDVSPAVLLLRSWTVPDAVAVQGGVSRAHVILFSRRVVFRAAAAAVYFRGDGQSAGQRAHRGILPSVPAVLRAALWNSAFPWPALFDPGGQPQGLLVSRRNPVGGDVVGPSLCAREGVANGEGQGSRRRRKMEIRTGVALAGGSSPSGPDPRGRRGICLDMVSHGPQ